MKFKTEDFQKSCGCRSVGECNCNTFAQQDAFNALVDAFAEQMKKKFSKKWTEGFHGWDDDDIEKDGWDAETIHIRILNHLYKEQPDPVDIANFAAFLWNMEN